MIDEKKSPKLKKKVKQDKNKKDSMNELNIFTSNDVFEKCCFNDTA